MAGQRRRHKQLEETNLTAARDLDALIEDDLASSAPKNHTPPRTSGREHRQPPPGTAQEHQE
jgi:hypothetical protein